MPRLYPLAVTVACALGLASAPISASAADPSHRERAASEPRPTAPQPGGTVVTQEKKEKTVFDRIWEVPTIYKNKESDWLNELRFVGRLHLDQYNIDSELGHDQDWIVRRWRMGLKAELFRNHLTAHVEVDIDPQNDDPAYRRLTDAYLAWKFSDAVRFTVGKHGAKFTLDGATSSNELLTIDRSNVANNFWFPTEYMPGASLSGKVGQWVYNTGFYSGGSESPEFGNFDAGNFYLASLGYDFGKALGLKRALLRGDYVFNDPDPESTFTRSFEQIGSLVLMLDGGRWGFSGELTAGRGSLRQSDAFGLTAMPWFNLTDHLQIVGRYTKIASDEPNGVRFSRYESFQTSARGDEYHELYAGLNYYLHGHKLKVQTGLTYTTMHDEAGDGGDFEGWTWTTALRVSW
jgi:phosphate-selective porin OprO and OprP